MKQVDEKKKEWEESCISQFKKEGDKYESYIKTSLGLPTKSEQDAKSEEKNT